MKAPDVPAASVLSAPWRHAFNVSTSAIVQQIEGIDRLQAASRTSGTAVLGRAANPEAPAEVR
ncbi:hypothetical protein L13192_08546 [Pyrenophora tritici-repentis]|uniref:Uncharacterized protein n=1 Tax=Pyrenophora tritici-repentis TaxID=45151 RepID=A0A316ZTK5_9PLEO|nr:hypothetical protein Ptr86124_012074 [Pyrenophora tritici-repentis]KAI1667837.1 hypothetical protein L13192_08546 [Pyrenophora tritici-repentis]KAI1680047.1 hypothetical protein KJE20_10687 [Pyrenophora tritici-repentis]